jgi:hypothetical protein
LLFLGEKKFDSPLTCGSPLTGLEVFAIALGATLVVGELAQHLHIACDSILNLPATTKYGYGKHESTLSTYEKEKALQVGLRHVAPTSPSAEV